MHVNEVVFSIQTPTGLVEVECNYKECSVLFHSSLIDDNDDTSEEELKDIDLAVEKAQVLYRRICG